MSFVTTFYVVHEREKHPTQGMLI